MLDTIMLSLRTSDGLDLQRFRDRFGDRAASAVSATLQGHVEHGLVVPFADGAGGVQWRSSSDRGSSSSVTVGAVAGSVRLRAPEGFLLSNAVISDVFAALDRSPAAAR